MAYIGMACIVTAYSYGRCSYGLHSRGLCSYGAPPHPRARRLPPASTEGPYSVSVAAAGIACIIGVLHLTWRTEDSVPSHQCGDVLTWAREHGARIPKLAVTNFFFQLPPEDKANAGKWWNELATRRSTIATGM